MILATTLLVLRGRKNVVSLKAWWQCLVLAGLIIPVAATAPGS
ncbi:hypothetical protein VS883_28025 [Escherichia coli]